MSSVLLILVDEGDHLDVAILEHLVRALVIRVGKGGLLIVLEGVIAFGALLFKSMSEIVPYALHVITQVAKVQETQVSLEGYRDLESNWGLPRGELLLGRALIYGGIQAGGACKILRGLFPWSGAEIVDDVGGDEPAWYTCWLLLSYLDLQNARRLLSRKEGCIVALIDRSLSRPPCVHGGTEVFGVNESQYVLKHVLEGIASRPIEGAALCV